MKKTLFATVVMLAASAAADAASATASIGVTILGTGGPDPAASAVTLAAERPFVADGRGAIAGSFRVAGARRAAYSVLVPSEVRASGERGEIVVRPAGGGGRLLPESGRGDMALDFRPDGSPDPGRYAGTFGVTVAYD